jgi:hypothetical protein
MKITKQYIKQLIKEELKTILNERSNIPYKAAAPPGKRLKGYVPPEEVTLPSKEKLGDVDPHPLAAKGRDAADARYRREKYKMTLADKLDQVEEKIAAMNDHWRSNYGQYKYRPDELAEFKAAFKRWNMKKAHIEKLMRSQGMRALTDQHKINPRKS